MAYLGILAGIVLIALGLFELALFAFADRLSRPAERDEHEDGV